MKPELLLREATGEDNAAVASLCARLDPADYMLTAWPEWMKSPGDVQLVAEWQGRFVGCVRAGVVGEGQAFLQGLRVDPGHRRMGVARALMVGLEDRLRHRQVVVQRAVTSESNLPALDLLAGLGWRRAKSVVRRRHFEVARGDLVGALRRVSLAPNPDEEPLLMSRRGLAYFGRIYQSADRQWILEEWKEGRIYGSSGSWCAFDSIADGPLWIHTLSVGPGALRGFLAGLIEGGREGPRQEVILDADAAPEAQSVLDALGFAPGTLEDRYAVLEQIA
jgi:ribosomal protein S18 acetylase RimI-like enzyme